VPAPNARPLAQIDLLLPATPTALAAVHAALGCFWAALAGAGVEPTTTWRHEFTTGVAEITANIIRHAYPPGAAAGSLHLRLSARRDAAIARFADRGVAFAPPPVAAASDLPEGGMGLLVARACFDDLHYRRRCGAANAWRLIKRFPAAESAREGT
jgi:anti-sigma regulatory factor (Ser/Thr protein kinase)